MFDMFLAGILVVGFLWLMHYSGKMLRTKHDSDIRVVWYFYGLTVVISSLIGLWAVNYGAINSSGSFVGEAGAFINNLIKASVDINLSIIIILAFLSLVLLPQFICYLFSGVYGVAKSPIYISESLSFLIWGVVKTFVVVSGVTTTITLFGAVLSWKSFDINNILGWILLSMSFCLFSFLTLMMYRESEEVVKDINNITPDFIINLFNRFHGMLTRNL